MFERTNKVSEQKRIYKSYSRGRQASILFARAAEYTEY